MTLSLAYRRPINLLIYLTARTQWNLHFSNLLDNLYKVKCVRFLSNTICFCKLQSKEVGIQMQDELLKVTTELQTVSI